MTRPHFFRSPCNPFHRPDESHPAMSLAVILDSLCLSVDTLQILEFPAVGATRKIFQEKSRQRTSDKKTHYFSIRYNASKSNQGNLPARLSTFAYTTGKQCPTKQKTLMNSILLATNENAPNHSGRSENQRLKAEIAYWNNDSLDKPFFSRISRKRLRPSTWICRTRSRVRPISRPTSSSVLLS
ncbi:hypothetical protein D3C76_484920 [compost metagenome]